MQLSLCGSTLLLAVAALQLQFLSANPMERLPGTDVGSKTSVPPEKQSTPSLEASKKIDLEAKGGGLRDGKGQVVSALTQDELLEMFKNLDTNLETYKHWKENGKVLLTQGTLKKHVILEDKSSEKEDALTELSSFLGTYVEDMLASLQKCDVSSIAKADRAMNQYLSDPQRKMRWADPQEKWSYNTLYTFVVATYTMLHFWGKIASAMCQVGHYPDGSVGFTYDDKNPFTHKIEAIYGKVKMMAWKKDFDEMYPILDQFRGNIMKIHFSDIPLLL